MDDRWAFEDLEVTNATSNCGEVGLMKRGDLISVIRFGLRAARVARSGERGMHLLRTIFDF